jgi:DHA1 family tetracycline resistance protein-like MFS transporter
VPDNAQGELQGALSSLTSLSAILAPVLLTSAFARYSAPDAEPYLPGAAFLIGAAVTALGLCTAAWALLRPAQPVREGA